MLAPVAASILRSRAVSLRIKPTVIASTLSAIRTPASVTSVRSWDKDACVDLSSMLTPAAAASCRAWLICPAVRGWRVCISQPAGRAVNPRDRRA